MKIYSVINMDIVGSRKVKDRRQLQVNLNDYISYVNDKYAGILVSPAAITLGDEWQVITVKPSEAYNLVHQFQQLLWKDNIELYAGIGIGQLSTPVSDDIRKMDGPCFHTARDAVNIAKNGDRLKNKYNLNKLNRIFLLSGDISDNLGPDILDFYYTSKGRYNEPAIQEIAAAAESPFHETGKSLLPDRFMLERTINLIIENNEILKAKMTGKQKEIYISYSKHGSYRKIIDAGNFKQETIGGISQKLNSASYFTIQRNHHMVSALLDTYSNMGG